MAFRRQSLSLFIAALIIFGLTAILPVAYMLPQFIFKSLSQPSTITNAIVDSRQLVLMGRSLTIASSAAMIALCLGLPVAIILAAKDLPCRGLFYFLVLIPILIPSYVMAGAWIHLLSTTGVINKKLASLFGPATKLTPFSMAGCAWCLGISFFPVIAIIVAAGLSKIDRNLIDIARLSTNRWGVFRYSILPQIWPHLIASICLVIIFVLAQYGVPSLLGVNTYPVEIFAQFSAFYDDTAAFATACPLIGLVVFLILLQRRIMRGLDYVRITPSSETDNPIRMNNLKYYAIAFLISLFIITTVFPFSSVLAHTQSFTKVWLTLPTYSDCFVTTSILALLAAVISTIIAFPIGHYLAYNHSRFGRTIDIICWLPIAIPGTIIGLGLVKLHSWAPALQKADSFGFLLLCAHIGLFSAFSIRIFEAAHKQADPNVSEAAAIDCRRWYQRWFYIDMPIHSPAITASMIVVFVLVIGELNATVLLIPPGKTTLAVTIDNLLHYGANVQASILCLAEAALVVLVVGAGLLIRYLAKRK
ncbi:MAG: iron ABC transporter permease [Planctomycetota bacterium]|nr:MAG: iron ABC transporter permease [Planctomycetota bacterium]